MVFLTRTLKNSKYILDSPLYNFRTPGPLDYIDSKFLPEAYKKFYREWKEKEKAPVHYIPTEGIYEKDEDGQTVPVQNVPIPLVFPEQMNDGIWGGEAVIQGFKKKKPKVPKHPHFWIPKLIDGVVYSEVLNKHMKAIITPRVIQLINQNFGFDYYLLRTPACDLHTLLSLKLKQKILHALYYKTLYPDNEAKRNEVYEKYKQFLDNYTEEEIQWYGLTLTEAQIKTEFMRAEEREQKIVPLKHELRKQFLEHLERTTEKEEPTTWWRKKLFPF